MEWGDCAKYKINHPGKFSVIYTKTCSSHLLRYLHLVSVENINRKLLTSKNLISIFWGATALTGPRTPHFEVLDHTQLDAYTRQHFLQLVAEAATYTIQNKHKSRISMEAEGFEPAITEIEWPQARTEGPRGHLDWKFHNCQILYVKVNKLKNVLL